MKQNKEVSDEKLLKVGLGIGKGELRLEGNLQFGWVRRTDKKYSASGNDPEVKEGIITEETE